MTANIKARKKLSALYDRGVEVRFGPAGPRIGPFEGPADKDDVCLWVAIPSPLQKEQAARDARASSVLARSRAKRDNESPDGLVAQSFVEEMELETLIDYLVLADQGERDREAERYVLEKPEWEDMPALQDQMRKYDDGELPKEGPEYDTLMERDREYGQQVRNRRIELTDAAREALRLLPRAELEKRAVDHQLERLSSEVFVREYTRLMVYYGARDIDDHKLLFFDSPTELASQDEEVQETLEEALGGFIESEAEAKNVPEAEDGSQPSAPPSVQETSESSTPTESTD